MEDTKSVAVGGGTSGVFDGSIKQELVASGKGLDCGCERVDG